MHNKWFYYSIAFLASLTYVGLIMFTPASPSASRLGLNQGELLLLRFTIAVPYIITWFLAMYGLSALDKYLQSSKKKSDAIIKLLHSFWVGLLIVALGTLVVGVLGGVRPYFYPNTPPYQLLTIIMNYLYVFPPLIGFFLMFKKISQLRLSKELSGYKQRSYVSNTIIVIIVAIFYLFLLFTNPLRQASSDPTIPATYYLSDGFIIGTIAVPLMVAWWFGFSVAFSVGDIVPHLTRIDIYKGVNRILYGIWAIIFTSILIQSLLSLGTARLLQIGLGLLLFIIYIFVILQGVGYLFLALGAKNLQQSKS